MLFTITLPGTLSNILQIALKLIECHPISIEAINDEKKLAGSWRPSSAYMYSSWEIQVLRTRGWKLESVSCNSWATATIPVMDEMMETFALRFHNFWTGSTISETIGEITRTLILFPERIVWNEWKNLRFRTRPVTRGAHWVRTSRPWAENVTYLKGPVSYPDGLWISWGATRSVLKLHVFATLPLSSCSCEQSASALRRLNNYLRCTQKEERLTAGTCAHPLPRSYWCWHCL